MMSCFPLHPPKRAYVQAAKGALHRNKFFIVFLPRAADSMYEAHLFSPMAQKVGPRAFSMTMRVLAKTNMIYVCKF